MPIEGLALEIGSFFEWQDLAVERDYSFPPWLPQGDDISFLFSGRAAIELALKDIALSKKIERVLLPSYSCDSMKQPFIDAGLDIKYYEVTYTPEKGLSYDMGSHQECDLLLILNYFGLMTGSLESIVEEFQSNGGIVIEDITHSLLSDRPSSKADYLIASLRKWFPIASGGYIVKNKGTLVSKPSESSDHLVRDKYMAMKLKRDFLEGQDISKEEFLSISQDFEKLFKVIDYTYKIDSISLSIVNNIDIEEIKSQRRLNGERLYKGLKKSDFLKLLIPETDFMKACPLFIPIMLDKEKRDSLREFLINKDIYCPIHWPRSIYPQIGIEDMELSLICDQRYSLGDMDKILEQINNWQLINWKTI